MKQIIISAAVLAGVLGFSGETKACGEDVLETLARRAVSEDAAVADKAIARLRAAGPAGLAAMCEVHADAIKQKPSPKLCAALDAVAQQKDSVASRLFWYTDFEQAKAAARASGRPILSLRLLGKLNEELSCANSRFFRTALYANATVSQALRERFVLHWQSVRPVPKITIDFGDGRVLEQTITGNSIHYVLDADGHPIDALPGLYGPQAFLRALVRAEEAAKLSTGKSGEERVASLRQWRNARIRELDSQLATDLAKIGATQADDAAWIKIAALHREDARLDAGSRALMAAKNPEAPMNAKNPDAFAAGRIAVSKSGQENPLLRAMRSFERSMAEDTVRNEFVLHRQIHDWLAIGAGDVGVDRLNERVYAQLFLMPSTDPWLGLAPASVYTALNDGGLHQPKNKKSNEAASGVVGQLFIRANGTDEVH